MSPAPEKRLHAGSTRQQGASPWSKKSRIAMLLWESAWLLGCSWTPQALNRWRLLVLRLFGARIIGRPRVHPGTRIQIPWNLELHDRARTESQTALYSLDRIVLGEGAHVGAEAYLCTGTHDLSHPALPLVTSPIVVEAGARVGVRAFVMPGVTVGAGARVAAGSVVTRSVAPGARVAGNPAGAEAGGSP